LTENQRRLDGLTVNQTRVEGLTADQARVERLNADRSRVAPSVDLACRSRAASLSGHPRSKPVWRHPLQ